MVNVDPVPILCPVGVTSAPRVVEVASPSVVDQCLQCVIGCMRPSVDVLSPARMCGPWVLKYLTRPSIWCRAIGSSERVHWMWADTTVMMPAGESSCRDVGR